jgi:hypothetical protein
MTLRETPLSASCFNWRLSSLKVPPASSSAASSASDWTFALASMTSSTLNGAPSAAVAAYWLA